MASADQLIKDDLMSELIKNQQHLSKWVREQAGPLDIAVAFWGAGALKDLGLDRKERQIRVLLDLSAGATNPSVVRELVSTYPGMIRCVDRLHAKTFIAENEVAVGSANASANGLGLEGSEATQWRELGMLSSDSSAVLEAKGWFAELWSLAKPIDLEGDEFMDAQRAWSMRQINRPLAQTHKLPLITAAIADPDAFTNRQWYVVLDLVDMDDDAHDAIARKTAEIGRQAFAWQDWPEIPPHAHLIAFCKDDSGQFVFSSEDGAPEPVYFTGEENDGPMQFVAASYIPGFRKNLGNIREWRKLLKRGESKNFSWPGEGGMCMDLGEFVKAYRP